MPVFLVETYAPRDGADSLARRVREVSLAAEEVSKPGAEVGLLSAILVPEDDTSFYLLESPSARAVSDAMTRAGLRCDRITQAFVTPTQPPALSRGGTNK